MSFIFHRAKYERFPSFSMHRGLLSQGKDGVDSYVSLMLLPDKSKATKKKTAVKKRDLSPEYNERYLLCCPHILLLNPSNILSVVIFWSSPIAQRFEYALPADELRFRHLSVSVKNNSASFRSPDVIGQVCLRLLLSSPSTWYGLHYAHMAD